MISTDTSRQRSSITILRAGTADEPCLPSMTGGASSILITLSCSLPVNMLKQNSIPALNGHHLREAVAGLFHIRGDLDPFNALPAVPIDLRIRKMDQPDT